MFFHNSLGKKVVHAGPVNAVLIGQQKCTTLRWNVLLSSWLLFMDYALWLLEFISGWTSTFILAMTVSSFPNVDERKLTLVHVNRRLRKRGMNMIGGRWPLFVFSLLLAVRGNHCSVYLSVLWMLVQLIFCRLHGNCFVTPIEVTSSAVALTSCFVTSTYLYLWARRGTMRVQHNAVIPNRS